MIVPSPYVTAKEAAEYLGVHPNTIFKMVAKGTLRAGRAGKKLLFRVVWLEQAVEGRRR